MPSQEERDSVGDPRDDKVLADMRESLLELKRKQEASSPMAIVERLCREDNGIKRINLNLKEAGEYGCQFIDQWGNVITGFVSVVSLADAIQQCEKFWTSQVQKPQFDFKAVLDKLQPCPADEIKHRIFTTQQFMGALNQMYVHPLSEEHIIQLLEKNTKVIRLSNGSLWLFLNSIFERYTP